MATCDVSQLMTDGADFNGLSTHELLVAQAQLLCNVASTFDPSLFLLKAANLSDVANTATARTNIGLGTAAVQNVAFFNQVANNLSDVANVVTARTNLGLGTGNSPAFTGLTLSGMTAGSVLFAGTAGVVSQDNTNFFWNNTDKTLKVSGFTFGGTTPASVGTSPGTNGGIIGASGFGYGFNTSDNSDVSTLPSGGDTTIATTGVGGIGAFFSVRAGKGGSATAAATSSTGGQGGRFNVQGGTGGSATVAGTGSNTGGGGGRFALLGGTGGAATGATSGTNTGGVGGLITLTAGTGGAANTGSGSNTGGAGGTLTITGGLGGVGATAGGSGGAVILQGGPAPASPAADGGAVTVIGRDGSTTGTGGAGGSVTLTSGNAGGDNTVNRAGGTVTATAGNSKGSSVGGAVNVTAGTGGVGTGATGAVGGGITLTAGAGGSNATTSGAGGDITLSGGLGGAGGTPGAGGVIIFKVAPTTTLGEVARFDSTTGNLQLGNKLTWGSTSSATQDILLVREAAANLFQRNGSTAQTFRVATNYTDSSNYAGVELNGSISGGSPGLKMKAIGTFVAGGYALIIDNDSSGGIFFKTQAGHRWTVQNAGHLVAATDNTYDIGAAGATRPRTIYVGTSIVTPTLTSNATQVGFFGIGPVARAAALTQTYSTADRTLANNTSSDMATTAATNVAPWGFGTQAQADAIATKFNALRVDLDDLKQFVNALTDDMQAYGLEQ